jgi:hypothetical protein
MDEEDQFRAVLGFLDRVQGEVEVSGRSVESLDPDMVAKIRELAAGTLDEKQREQVLEEVARNRAGLELLATCLQRG